MSRFAIKWLQQPKPSNYPSAQEYLSLIFDEASVKEYVTKLRKAAERLRTATTSSPRSPALCPSAWLASRS